MSKREKRRKPVHPTTPAGTGARSPQAIAEAATALADRKRRKAEDKARADECRAAALAEYQRIEAENAEAAAEDMAPAIQRQAIVGHTAATRKAALPAAKRAELARLRALPPDQRLYLPSRHPGIEPEPTILRPAIAVHDGRRQAYQTLTEIQRLHRIAPQTYTSRHVRAAGRFLRDYVVGVEAARTGGKPPPPPTDGSDPPGPEDNRLAAIRRYNDARAALGPAAADIVVKIVLGGWTFQQLAERLDPSPTGRAPNLARTTGRVVSALDRLVEYYDGIKAERAESRPRPVHSGYGQPPPDFDDDAAMQPVGASGPIPAARSGTWRGGHATKVA